MYALHIKEIRNSVTFEDDPVSLLVLVLLGSPSCIFFPDVSEPLFALFLAGSTSPLKLSVSERRLLLFLTRFPGSVLGGSMFSFYSLVPRSHLQDPRSRTGQCQCILMRMRASTIECIINY